MIVMHWPTVAPRLAHVQVQASPSTLDALLLRQAAAAEERERLRLEHEAQLQRVQLAHAQHHMAACKLLT
jgi:hypothetical protein